MRLRKHRRFDWRQKPAKRMIPAMSRQKIFLMKFRLQAGVDAAQLATIGWQIAGAVRVVIPDAAKTMWQTGEEIRRALAQVDRSSFYSPIILSVPEGWSIKREVVKRQDQQSVIGG